MSLRKGLVRAGRTLDSPRQKSLGGAIPTMTLDNPGPSSFRPNCERP